MNIVEHVSFCYRFKGGLKSMIIMSKHIPLDGERIEVGMHQIIIYGIDFMGSGFAMRQTQIIAIDIQGGELNKTIIRGPNI